MAGCLSHAFWRVAARHGMFGRSTWPLITYRSRAVRSPTTHGGTSMPRKRPPFVELWRDRHGKVRVYFRKGKGPRLPLPSDITSQEFTTVYQAALAGQLAAPTKRERHEPDTPGTIASLIGSYNRSAPYLGLRQ